MILANLHSPCFYNSSNVSNFNIFSTLEQKILASCFAQIYMMILKTISHHAQLFQIIYNKIYIHSCRCWSLWGLLPQHTLRVFDPWNIDTYNNMYIGKSYRREASLTQFWFFKKWSSGFINNFTMDLKVVCFYLLLLLPHNYLKVDTRICLLLPQILKLILNHDER
jgi:hypothetical protein